VITGKGVWRVETDKSVISEGGLIKTLDEKYFYHCAEAETPLSEKHQIIIFSMLAARAFSIESCVDLKMSDSALDAWGDIVCKSYALLKKLGAVVDLTEDMLFGMKGNEHKVSNVFRHTDGLPKQTMLFFTAPGKQRYFLNLYNETRQASVGDFRNLLRLVFCNKHLTMEERNEIFDFCDEIATTKNIYVFRVETHKFHSPEYSTTFRDALLTL